MEIENNILKIRVDILNYLNKRNLGVYLNCGYYSVDTLEFAS